MSERKPAWLRSFAPDGNPQHLHAARCPCGLWCVESRDRVQWDKWDAGVIHGDDLTVAILLRRRLARIEYTPTGVILHNVWAGLGVVETGEYLAAHDCASPRITDRPWIPPASTRIRQDLSWLPVSHPTPGATDPWDTILDGVQEELPV